MVESLATRTATSFALPPRSVQAANAVVAKLCGTEALERWAQTGGSFRGTSFANRDLQRSLVTRAVFESCDFTESAATGVLWTDNEFLGCSFDRADFEFSDLSRCKFLPAASGAPTTVIGAGFNGVVLRGLRAERLVSRGSSFAYADFSGAELHDCELGGTFEGCIFSHAILSGISLMETNIDYADFQDCTLNDVSLPFLTLPYVFGIRPYQVGDSLKVAVPKQLGGAGVAQDQLDDLADDVIMFFAARGEYFPAANMALMMQRHDDLAALFSDGLREALRSEDYRAIKMMCKLIRAAEAQTGRFGRSTLRKFYNLITTCVGLSENPAVRNQYELHDGQIRAYLLGGPSDYLQIQFVSNSEDTTEANRISGLVVEILERVCQIAGADVKVIASRYSFNSKPLHEIDLQIVNVNVNLPHPPEVKSVSPWNQVTTLNLVVAVIGLLLNGVNTTKPLLANGQLTSPPATVIEITQENHIHIQNLIVPQTPRLSRDGVPMLCWDDTGLRCIPITEEDGTGIRISRPDSGGIHRSLPKT